MRSLTIVLIVVLRTTAFSQEAELPLISSDASEPSAAPEQIAHLLKAADHLSAAELNDLADRLRKIAEVTQIAQSSRGTLAAVPDSKRGRIESRQIIVNSQVMEVSLTKLRALRVNDDDVGGGRIGDLLTGGDAPMFNRKGLVRVGSPNSSFKTACLDAGDPALVALESLREMNLVRILANPTMVTMSGRPAHLHAGGQFPIVVERSPGAVCVEHKNYGTEFDVVPVLQKDGKLRLELRIRISEIDNLRTVTVDGATVPGLLVRELDSAIEMQPGQTFLLAGPIRTAVESEERVDPATEKRDAVDRSNEIQLLVSLTSEFVSAHSVPTEATRREANRRDR